MKDNKHLLKWAARILGGMAVLFFLSFIIGEGIPEIGNSENGQLRSIMSLFAFATLGYIFAWFREKEGGIFMMVAGFIMGADMFYIGGTKDIIAVLIYSLPFIIPPVAGHVVSPSKLCVLHIALSFIDLC